MKFTPLVLLSLITFAVTNVEAAIPEVSQKTIQAAEAINADPVMKKILEEATSPEGQKWRFNTQMEIVRIASPSRFEMRRQKEIMKRFVEEWGISPKNIMTRLDGELAGAGLQKVDGLPVYNACVRIPGSYSRNKSNTSYKGQYPKVLLEGLEQITLNLSISMLISPK